MKQLVYIIAFLLLAACTAEKIETAESQLVVEGWIENDGFPVVLLTRTFPVSDNSQNLDDLSDYLIRWAKVSITDGKDTVVLTGKSDRGYYPSYIYTTSRMRGEVGRTYRLIVEYANYYATAETTIPEPAKLDSVKVVKCNDTDDKYEIKAVVSNNDSSMGYYQFFSKTGSSSKQFVASFMGSVDISNISGTLEIPVFRGHQYTDSIYSPYYQYDDSVAIKCCHVDAFGYNFWSSYIKSNYLQTSAVLTKIVSVPTNITGGIGYWCGYGSTTRYVIIRDYVK